MHYTIGHPDSTYSYPGSKLVWKLLLAQDQLCSKPLDEHSYSQDRLCSGSCRKPDFIHVIPQKDHSQSHHVTCQQLAISLGLFFFSS